MTKCTSRLANKRTHIKLVSGVQEHLFIRVNEQIFCFFLMFSDNVRVVGGANTYEGRVEVYRSGYGWGTVCDDAWDVFDAKVVCRQLGLTYSNAQAIFCCANSFGQGSGQIWLDNVACTGSESRLQNCPHRGWGVHDCVHGEDAGVKCG